ncbi:hypothetical protein I5E97_01640 [Proteus hauseri]|uniref:Secreted protein n=1 Tax=Proteus cibi TaxID=2050966 RepID=A0ABU6E9J6_9GAMM|nr:MULTISPECIES: hypothetical protein [Proteus]MBG6029750.1 hypothetical protein [Proteus hauseri]MBS6211246.1 hypothetical protein [Proteus hauseri]MEB6855743.1 hypothetical protein [Proteus cibi]MEB7088264.1 hypothetical protein [Proteus cibi]
MTDIIALPLLFPFVTFVLIEALRRLFSCTSCVRLIIGEFLMEKGVESVNDSQIWQNSYLKINLKTKLFKIKF